MPIDPFSTYQRSASSSQPLSAKGLDMLFGPIFGQNWSTNLFQQVAQQPTQSTGAQSVTNAILGRSPFSQGGMGSSMGQMPQSRQMGMGLGPNQNSSLFHTDNRTHGGMGGASHL